ncbi:MAG TPA: hypothetical protein VKS60_21910 [Stellaceae bacterium]|nr:hypothetical protein [Stellaceae bacterium]
MFNRKISPAKAPTAAVAPRPTLAELSPEYVRLSRLSAELSQRHDELIALLLPITRRIAERGNSGMWWGSPRAAEVKKPSAAEIGAAELLGDGAPAPPPPAMPRVDAETAEMDRLSRELEIVEEAQRIVGPRLERERTAASIRLCDLVLPEYRAIVDRMFDALVALGEAMLDQKDLVAGLRLEGALPGALRLLRLDALGDPTDSGSELRRLFAEAIEHGHIAADRLPQTWRRTKS